MKNLLYVGPSWAVRDFNSTDTQLTNSLQSTYTNIKKECNLKVTDLSEYGASNFDMLDKIKSHSGYDGIVWVYCEPIHDLELLNICSKQEFLTSPDFWNMRALANKHTLDEMNNLNIPIGLIGSHSDIFDCNHRNLTIIHDSWQLFLIDSINYDYVDVGRGFQGWGADVAHRWMAQYRINPSKEITDKITDTFFLWSLLIEKDLFWEVHPSRKGNELFSKKINKPLHLWIDKL